MKNFFYIFFKGDADGKIILEIIDANTFSMKKLFCSP